MPHISLWLAHIGPALAEMMLYYVPLLRTGNTPIPSEIHRVFCIVQSISSICMAALIHQLPISSLPEPPFNAWPFSASSQQE